MNARNGAQLEKLKLQLGEPEVIAVTHPRGLPCQSRWAGDQVMWTLEDGRKFYADPYVQERMDALGVCPRVPFEIELVEVSHGNRRSVEIVVRALRGRSIGNTIAAADARTPAAAGHHKDVQPRDPQHIAPAPQAPPVNGAGDTHAAIMARCYCQAVDIALATIACAEAKGLRLTAQFEDVRAMGTALLISETGRR